MKKIFNLGMVLLFMVGAISISLPEIAAASDNDNDNPGALNVDEEYLENQEYYNDLEEQRDKEIEIREERLLMSRAASTGYFTIPVTYNKQEYSNFCGPASGRQALSFHKAKSNSKEAIPTQEHFGFTIGVIKNGSGTSSTYLAQGLNKYKDVYGFSANPYIVGNISQFANPETTLESRVRDTLSGKKTAPILLLRTKWLENYNGKNFRHYVTVSGYDGPNKKMRLVDPNHYTEYTSGGSYWAPIAKATSKLGVTRSVNEADLESENPVMVW